MTKEELKGALLAIQRKLEEIKGNVSWRERRQIESTLGVLVRLIESLESEDVSDFNRKYREFITKLNELIERDSLNFHREEWSIFVSRLNSLKEDVFGRESTMGRRGFLKKTGVAAAGVGLMGRKAFGSEPQVYLIEGNGRNCYGFFTNIVRNHGDILKPSYVPNHSYGWQYSDTKENLLDSDVNQGAHPKLTNILNLLAKRFRGIGLDREWDLLSKIGEVKKIILIHSYDPILFLSDANRLNVIEAVKRFELKFYVYCFIPYFSSARSKYISDPRSLQMSSQMAERIKKFYQGIAVECYTSTPRDLEDEEERKLADEEFVRKIKEWK